MCGELCKTEKLLPCVYIVSDRCHTYSDLVLTVKAVALLGASPIPYQGSQCQAEVPHSPVLVVGHGGFLFTLLKLHLLFLSFRGPGVPGREEGTFSQEQKQ